MNDQNNKQIDVLSKTDESDFPETILILEEDKNYRFLVDCLLSRSGFKGQLQAFDTIEHLFFHLLKNSNRICYTSLVIILAVDPEQTGELTTNMIFSGLRNICPVPIIIHANHLTENFCTFCYASGCYACLVKTHDAAELISVLRACKPESL